jgi:tetratricopeptide (TPR) repeat protein
MRSFSVGTVILLMSMLLPVAAVPLDNWAKERIEGLAAGKARDYKKAEKLLKEAVQQATEFGDKGDRLVIALNDLGNLYATEHKYDDARLVFLRVLKLSELKYGKSSTALIGPLNNVVKVTCAGGKCSDTVPELKRLLQIKQNAGAACVRDLPVALLLLGEAYEQQKKYPDSVDYIKQAVAAQTKLTGAGSRQTIQLSLNLARLYQEMSKYDEGERLCKKALEDEEGICRASDQLVIATLSRYKAILSANGRQREAAKLSFSSRLRD